MKEGMKILVGIDGSEYSMWALVEASNVAKRFLGSVKAITVKARNGKRCGENSAEGTKVFGN
jgi:nucleotide-binding universal stress UspA family protein